MASPSTLVQELVERRRKLLSMDNQVARDIMNKIVGRCHKATDEEIATGEISMDKKEMDPITSAHHYLYRVIVEECKKHHLTLYDGFHGKHDDNETECYCKGMPDVNTFCISFTADADDDKKGAEPEPSIGRSLALRQRKLVSCENPDVKKIIDTIVEKCRAAPDEAIVKKKIIILAAALSPMTTDSHFLFSIVLRHLPKGLFISVHDYHHKLGCIADSDDCDDGDGCDCDYTVDSFVVRFEC